MKLLLQDFQHFHDCAELMRGGSRLHCLGDELRELLAEREPVRRHLEMTATAFFEAITQQFDREHREHLSQQLVGWDVRLATAAERRQFEHSRLVNRMEVIHMAFDRRRSDRGDQVDGYLHALLDDFLVAWNEYEQAGEQLVHELRAPELRDHE